MSLQNETPNVPENEEQKFDIDVQAKEWIEQQIEEEVNRIRKVGSSVLPLKILNCGIVPNFDRRKAKAVNRVELDTNIDVNKIQQVMVSPPVSYPHKAHFSYVNLILVTGQPIPFIAPYLYQNNLKVTQPESEEDGRKYPSKLVTLKNDLREFLFINKRGIRARITIHEYFDGLLQRQFNASPFATHRSDRRPSKLAIFDFDSTLFLSPLLSPSLWDSSLLNALTTENQFGPGWWRDIRSLELGPVDDLEKNGWKGYWNEDIVAQARQAISDEDTMAIVLTGRRYHPFHRVVPAMLSSKSLHFDLIGLRPDPETEAETVWMGKGGNVIYNPQSVFASTMDFKTSFIVNLLDNVPSLRSVTMWDDRRHHVDKFRYYLDHLCKKSLIEKGEVIYVPALRPKYNPAWERKVVNHILETHNLALHEHRQGKTNGTKWPPLIWEKDDATVSESKGRLSGRPGDFTLVPVRTATIVQLGKEDAARLHQLYEPRYKDSLNKTEVALWLSEGAESPELFGDRVILHRKALPKDDVPFGGIGTVVDVKVIAISKPSRQHGMTLKVMMKPQDKTQYSSEEYLLPMWYKPSEHGMVSKASYQWTYFDASEQELVKGTIDYMYSLGVEALRKSDNKRKRENESEQDVQDTKVAKIIKET
ncbi:uncharacterized protein BYT42DRAFT_537361 [Radiomyces spectabilis]|uniref:uncharacterized protein n=1 Tax=Radiomyces spectabilis TaxID=64574 RepID=UPI00221F6C60|nr:uncharacterized protein BYT42DRAFT_537361 [Radiomyces spectabilis]KAI8371578.1 hypothetical protein BYT42DRAFT_537361 [Radiomyces spectabilis]